MPKPFVWWNCEDILDLLCMVHAQGAVNLRLEYHEGEEESLRLVDRETGEVCGAYNWSHVCPPDCP